MAGPGSLYFRPTRVVERVDTSSADHEVLARLEAHLARWKNSPVHFVQQAICADLEPWQCDVLDTIADPAVENVALRACHGVGKTTLLAWLTIWFTTTRAYARLPTTAPTFNKQVRDVLWGEVWKWWHGEGGMGLTPNVPELAGQFELSRTRLQNRLAPANWFAVGIASAKAANLEGYHSPHLMVIIDEAKGVPRMTYEALHGARTTQEAKIVLASTPGGPLGEFYKVFTEYRQTWKNLFIIHPFWLKHKLRRREAKPFSTSGTYYSKRVRKEWIEERALEWGEDSPVFISRAVGDFPSIEGDMLVPLPLLEEAEHREDGVDGPVVIACDVARFGRDRTVILVGRGGTLLHGEVVSRNILETTATIIEAEGIGDDERHPRYRDEVATANAITRLRAEWGAEFIVVDDTGVGGGVTTILKRNGERVIPIHFGTRPTDLPRDEEAAKSRQARHLLDSMYVNLKAQMGFALKDGFTDGLISFGRMPATENRSRNSIVESLIAQTSMIRTEMDAKGRWRIVDPDDQDEQMELAVGSVEGRKSPDHFHAMLLYWWIAGGRARAQLPKSGQAPPPGPVRIGERRGVAAYDGQARRAAAGVTAGQASHVRRHYR